MKEKKSIMIVEDELDLAKMLKIRLESHGYDVWITSEGSKAISQIKTAPPDLIILDVNLPNMSGIEFYKKICDKQGKSQYPVLMLTARDELQEFFKSMHIDGFMTKPFNFNELLALIQKVLSSHAASVVYIFDAATNKTVMELKKRMKTQGHKVIATQDISAFKKNIEKNPPKIIFLEYSQRGMSCEETIKIIKQILRINLKKKDNEPLGIPIIVYTLSDGDYSEKSLAAGASWYIGKPKSYKDFLEAI